MPIAVDAKPPVISGKGSGSNRWSIALAGTALQMCLGTVYAWSYFQKPLVDQYGWSNSQVAWVFSLAICCLGLAAAWGGRRMNQWGPRGLAVAGGALFGGGYLVAALALREKNLPLLYLGYGLLGGIGLGLGYVTPVATAAKWFPDKKGFVTGLVVMGFGLGALLMSKLLAPALMALMNGNLAGVFFCLGLFFMPACMLLGWLLHNPPADEEMNGLIKKAPGQTRQAVSPGIGSVLSHGSRGRFCTMWMVFFCNIVAGIAMIGFQSPLFQDLLNRTGSKISPSQLATYGATLIAASSLFNGVGRLFWGGISDRMGRARTFRILLGTQVLVFLGLSRVSQPWLFAILVCYVLLCYGGGFGAMPSFVLEVFGNRLMPVAYGLILTAWSAAGLVGPQIVAWLKDHDPQRASAQSFLVGAAFLALGSTLSFLLSDTPVKAGNPTHPDRLS